MKKYILEFNNVSKFFKPPPSYYIFFRTNLKFPSIKALVDVSFCVEEGKILGILGPNGAGKTTILKIISTLILPDKGKVKVGGFEVGKDDEKIKSIIGFVSSEERSFYERLTGRKNLEFFASMHGLNNKQSEPRINYLLDLFGINYDNRRLNTYSTGMKRKLSIARALLHNPKILLFDEPTKSLDYNSACHLKEIIKKLAQEGKTIILATHAIKDALDLCNMFIILKEGKIHNKLSLEELEKYYGYANLSEVYMKLVGND